MNISLENSDLGNSYDENEKKSNLSGDCFSISEFETNLKLAAISDYDGSGELLINNTEQKYYGSPCVILLDKAKLHESWGDTVVILWYNK